MIVTDEVKEKEVEEKLEEELEEIDLGELGWLMPTMGDVADVLAAALGIHYLDKLVSYVEPYIGGILGRWTKLAVAYIIYKAGFRVHPLVKMAGFGMLARAAEELIAPLLPASPSVFEKDKNKIVDVYQLALEYAGRR